MEEHAHALLDAIEAAVPGWVTRCVERRLLDYRGVADREVMAAAVVAGRQAQADVASDLRALLEADIDAQATTPLSLLRRAVRYPTEVLRSAGVPPVQRDAFAESTFPDDDYDLAPASLGDVDPDLVDVGLAWGAAKAMAHRRRHGGGY
jgi:DNA-directed RNA polymerase specialized sigma24 family protein